MIPIVPIVGKSDVGKTTFVEKVIRELKSRGHTVAVIKHHVHEFDIDQPGKDTWKFAQAGADTVAISSPGKSAVIQKTDHDLTLDELEQTLIHNVDIIIAEGYKRSTKPKVEVHRQATSQELLCSEEELIALVTDEPLPMNVPQFDLDDPAGLVDLLEERFLKPPEAAVIELTADGREVPLEGFAKDIVANGIMGLISALKGVGEPKEVTIRIKVP
jgi:molybdopterin-guanine dinucleotide biosynthesis adapter protein